MKNNASMIIMEKKKLDKIKLVNKFVSLYVDNHNKKLWNENDTFDVMCWFAGELIVKIYESHIIPTDELHKRMKDKLTEWIDDVFEQIKYEEE